MARPAAPYRAVLIACDTPVDRRWSGWLTARLRRFRTPHALMRAGVAAQTFDEAEASAHPGVFATADECLLLAVVARKPGG